MNAIIRSLMVLVLVLAVADLAWAQGIPEPISTNRPSRRPATGSIREGVAPAGPSQFLQSLDRARRFLEEARNLTNVQSAAGAARCSERLQDAKTMLVHAGKTAKPYQKQEIGTIVQKIDRARFQAVNLDQGKAWMAIDAIVKDVQKLITKSVSFE
jgi:acyl-CoA reductase-like NAD-dependent aldehyde dehydrogenase